jgi:hypothetical protein
MPRPAKTSTTPRTKKPRPPPSPPPPPPAPLTAFQKTALQAAEAEVDKPKLGGFAKEKTRELSEMIVKARAEAAQLSFFGGSVEDVASKNRLAERLEKYTVQLNNTTPDGADTFTAPSRKRKPTTAPEAVASPRPKATRTNVTPALVAPSTNVTPALETPPRQTEELWMAPLPQDFLQDSRPTTHGLLHQLFDLSNALEAIPAPMDFPSLAPLPPEPEVFFEASLAEHAQTNGVSLSALLLKPS